jgi:hypothetical protein
MEIVFCSETSVNCLTTPFRIPEDSSLRMYTRTWKARFPYLFPPVEVEVTLRLTVSQSVSQYVLVSSTLVGLATTFYFLSECCCLKFAVLFLWGALSDERTGLQFAV